jgi:DNA-binding transcriptional LysR family regulator
LTPEVVGELDFDLFVIGMNDLLGAMRVFVRVARAGSFSKGGREAGMSQSSASRVIAALEREIGAQLLTRTTRAVVLTDAGSDYLLRTELILEALDEANHAVRGTGELRGVLRLGLPTSIAVREIIPRLPRFLERHPALRLDLLLVDSPQDLVREGVDVAVRIGDLPDSRATARLIGFSQRLLVASPSYLRHAGIPAAPANLADHALILGPPGMTSGAWSFERDGRTVSVRIKPRLTSTVNEGATAAAIAGLGILSTGLWGCRAELTAGTLVPVLEAWKMGSMEIHAIFPAGRAAKQSARAFVDHLIEDLKQRPV